MAAGNVSTWMRWRQLDAVSVLGGLLGTRTLNPRIRSPRARELSPRPWRPSSGPLGVGRRASVLSERAGGVQSGSDSSVIEVGKPLPPANGAVQTMDPEVFSAPTWSRSVARSRLDAGPSGDCAGEEGGFTLGSVRSVSCKFSCKDAAGHAIRASSAADSPYFATFFVRPQGLEP